MYIYIYMYICIYVFVYIYIHIYKYVYRCVCVCDELRGGVIMHICCEICYAQADSLSCGEGFGESD